jgi:hypothetical protein
MSGQSPALSALLLSDVRRLHEFAGLVHEGKVTNVTLPGPIGP